ncbi:MAG: ABC transporter ATP-binding protein [Dehalococcoidia bacterium]
MLLEIRGLWQKYGDSEILKDIDLDIEQGETFVIIGPTGSGKTTLLRLIGLHDKPASGSIRFNGQEVTDSEKTRMAIRRRTAMVLQKPAVFNTSVYDNVAYGLKIRREKGDALRRKVSNALEMVGLSGHENRNARRLSGGETQRVALARAMVLEPELLLLDEPTANLDPTSTLNIEKLISQVIQQLDATVIMSTHDMFQGQRLADRMGVLMSGEMLQTGHPRQIFDLPQSKAIAELVGAENILRGLIASNAEGMVAVDIEGTAIEAISDFGPGAQVYACIRPEEITLSRAKDSTSARNTFPAEVTRIALFGPLARVEMDCGFPLVALITRRSAEEMDLQTGSQLQASFKATGVHILPQ